MTTTLARVVVRGSDLDRTAARLRLEAALGGCDLRPHGLPPAALLLVRRLTAPPGVGLPMEAGGVRPPPEWEAGLVAALERALRSAARPAREVVPADAEAVLFGDRAELLACLARDALDGTVWGRWWWRSALAAAGGQEAVQQAWLAEPTHVPAALEVLAAQGVAADVVRALPEPAAAAVADAVLRVFEVPTREPDRMGGAPPSARGDPPPPPAAPKPPPAHPEPAWHALVAEAGAPALGPEQRRLLAVALALRRAPALVRATGFPDAALAPPTGRAAQAGEHMWPAAGRAAPVTEPPDAPAPAARDVAAPAPAAAHRDAPAPPRVAERPAQRVPAPVGRPPAAPSASGARSAPRGGEAPGRPEARADAATACPEPSAPAAAPARGHPHPARGPSPRRERPQVRPLPSAPDRRAPAAPPVASPAGPAQGAEAAPPAADAADTPLARPVETQLGGLFYLLNLAIFLGLYGDFTRPREPAIALDPWDLVALLGEALLGERPDDPVWPALAKLAGRDTGEPPGDGFRPSAAWRVPAAWLEPFEPGGTWRWSPAGGVLRLLHPAGFFAVAVPRGGAPPALQLRRELRRVRCAATPVRGPLPAEPAGRLERWVARLAAYSAARLRHALGSDDLAAVLIRRPARVFVTPTHVDAVFSLAEHPIEIRLAGLDRTPGFVAATGRVVALHFE
jgi:hypothetical protein